MHEGIYVHAVGCTERGGYITLYTDKSESGKTSGGNSLEMKFPWRLFPLLFISCLWSLSIKFSIKVLTQIAALEW